MKLGEVVVLMDTLEARIRLNLINFLAHSGLKQKVIGPRLARLEEKWARPSPNDLFYN